MRGRIATLRSYSQPIELEEYEVPDPEPGGLIVEVEQATICGSDLHIWRGETAGEAASPAALGFGHEGFGRVVALGNGTTTDDAHQPLRIGDRVVHHVMETHVGRGPDPNTLRQYGQHPYFFTTFSDYLWIGAKRPVYRVPESLDDNVLSPVNCAMGAAVNALLAGGTTFGSRVVIFGAGGLGLTAAAAARDMGARQVIVLDRIDRRLALAKEFGADLTINVDEVPTLEDRVALVMDHTGGVGADVALELVGLAPLVPEGLTMLGRGGTFVEVGLFYTGTSASVDPALLLRGDRRLIGAAGYPPTLLPSLLSFLERAQGRYPFEQLTSHRFPLNDINDAMAKADWGNDGDDTVTRAAIVP